MAIDTASYQRYAQAVAAQNRRALLMGVQGATAGIANKDFEVDRDYVQNGWAGREAYMNEQQKLAAQEVYIRELVAMRPVEIEAIMQAELAEWAESNQNQRAALDAAVQSKAINQRGAEAAANLQGDRLRYQSTKLEKDINDHYVPSEATNSVVGTMVGNARALTQQYIEENEPAIISEWCRVNGVAEADLPPSQRTKILQEEHQAQLIAVVQRDVTDNIKHLPTDAQRMVAIKETANTLGVPLDTFAADPTVGATYQQAAAGALQEFRQLEADHIATNQEWNAKVSRTGGSSDAAFVERVQAYDQSLTPRQLGNVQAVRTGQPIPATVSQAPSNTQGGPTQGQGPGAQAPGGNTPQLVQAGSGGITAPGLANGEVGTPSGSPVATALQFTMEPERQRVEALVERIDAQPDAPEIVLARKGIEDSQEYKDWIARRGYPPSANADLLFKAFTNEMKNIETRANLEFRQQLKTNRQLGVVAPNVSLRERLGGPTRTPKPFSDNKPFPTPNRAPSMGVGKGQLTNPRQDALMEDPERRNG